MADLDTAFEKFTALAIAHAGVSATTILTIPTKTDRHYQLFITAKAQDDNSLGDRVGFIAEIEIVNDDGTVEANLNVIATNDPNTTGYTISETVSGTDVLIQITATADTVSAVAAVGTSFEQAIAGA